MSSEVSAPPAVTATGPTSGDQAQARDRARANIIRSQLLREQAEAAVAGAHTVAEVVRRRRRNLRIAKRRAGNLVRTPCVDVADLHVLYARTRDVRLRDRLIDAHRRLALHLARSFEGRGEDRDDLEQVSLFALMNAVERFDPSRGVKFSSYASLVISGELKRHFRDKRWAVRVPRGLQELYLRGRRASDDLRSQLGRAPTAAEIADVLGVEEEDVVAALEAGASYRSSSLDVNVPGTDLPRWSTFGDVDPHYSAVDERQATDALLAKVAPEDRALLRLYFGEGLSQSEVGERLGVSQVQVSRRLSRLVARLHALAAADES